MKIMKNTLLKLSPIKFRKLLIFKKIIDDSNLLENTYLKSIVIDEYNIQNKDFTIKNKFNQKYKGYLFYDLKHNFVGYYFYTINKPPLNSIPKIPKNSPWIFSMYVQPEHRGNNYQFEMLKHFEQLMSLKSYGILYCDVMNSNIASIKTFLKAGYQECGVYRIFIIGLRRFNWLNLKFGSWYKNESHNYN